MTNLVGKCDGRVDVMGFDIEPDAGTIEAACDAVMQGDALAAVEIVRQIVVGRTDDDRHVAETVVGFMIAHHHGVRVATP